MKPGPRNAITDVPGIAVGNAEDEGIRTGVTVVLPAERAVASVDARGGGTGTREIELLDPAATVEQVDAIVLSGGSAFGLDAAGGVMSWLAGQRRGFRVGEAVVPIVPTAILFDLSNGGDKLCFQNADGTGQPYRLLARYAAEAAGAEFRLGNAGAGFGATAGALKGGLGTASSIVEGGATIGAIAAVNAGGSAVIPGSGAFWAWPFERDGEFGSVAPPSSPPEELSFDFAGPESATAGANTTLAVVATDATLTKSQAKRVAVMAQAGFARALRPVHTPFDGDIVFAVSTGRRALSDDANIAVAQLGLFAADCVARAIARGVYEAETLGALEAYRDRFGEGKG
ncbi:MAG: P1 family peptidase [Alphaproteobacteria bacterium]|nr:P1 family peptidase [Alphaproteobacteria bacterium]